MSSSQPIGPRRAPTPIWKVDAPWLLAGLVLVPLVVFMQQFTLGMRSLTRATAPAALMASEELESPGISELTLDAKMAVKIARMEAEDGDTEREDPAATLKDLDALAVTRVERMRVALVAGELAGPAAALERLDALGAEAEKGGELAGDVAWFARVYREGVGAVPVEVQDALVDRHGWFAQVALVTGRPQGDPYRAEVLGGAERLGALVLALGFAGLVGFAAGLAVLGIAWRRWTRGELDLRFNEAVGRRVNLEVFVVFAGGFLFVLGMMLVMSAAGVAGSRAAIAVDELLVWSLVGVLAWPAIRGVPWSRFAWDVGLHSGEGVRKEVWCGVLGYVGGLPIYVLAMMAVSWVVKLAEGPQTGADPSGYPLFERPAGGSWGLLWLEAFSAVVWAPLIEEIVFRGALFRYLHPWLRPAGAIVATALVFGLVHPYTVAGLAQVGVMGLTLGALRLWRGSLIAPMVAHALHNGVIVLATAGLVRAIG